MTADKFVERNVLEPTGIVQVYKDYYWWCVDGDPKRALFFIYGGSKVGSPQCNLNEKIAERFGAWLAKEKQAQLIHIPLAFCPWEE